VYEKLMVTMRNMSRSTLPYLLRNSLIFWRLRYATKIRTNNNTSGKIKFSMVWFTLAPLPHGMHRPVLFRKYSGLHTAHKGPWWPAVQLVVPLRGLDKQVLGRGHSMNGVVCSPFGMFQ
jgi:hypothetical protein